MGAAPPAAAPRIVGRYVLYGEIASGGMATVHFGRLLGPAGFARPVAIKRLHAQFAKDPDFVKMFFDEARLAARIAHPNVIPTLDVVSSDGEVFLVMDYVRGASLAQLVRTVRRRGDRVQPIIGVGIVGGMLQGLHAAHEATNDRGERLDLVHRDVSPQNVLVGTDGVARLLDFGVAKASGRLQTTRDGQLKGKLAYMSPEQVRGEPLTRRTDIYAASVVLWEVLTGKRLFYAENEASVLARVLNSDVPAPSSIIPDLPRSFDRIVGRGLERDPDKRYATAREMAADLVAVIGVASPTDVGDWVEQTAADGLRQTAALIAEIERAASEGPRPGGGADLARSDRPAGDAPSSVWHEATKKEGLPAHSSREASQVSSLSLARASNPPGPSPRKRFSALAASAGAVTLLFVVFALMQLRAKGIGADPVANPNEMALGASSKLLISPAPRPSVAPDRVGLTRVEDLPPPDAPSSAREGAREAGSGAERLGSTAAAMVPPLPRPQNPAAAVRARPASTESAECNPPYTADAKGHIHFKPNCM
jgi:serine/threonine-protein kinase